MQNYGQLICEQEFSNKDIIYGICTNTEMVGVEKKSDPDIGSEQLFVKHNKTHVIHCNVNVDTVLILKQKIYSKTNIPCSRMYLVSQGKPLKDELLLKDYNIQNNHTVEVNIRMDSVQETSADLYSPNIKHIHAVSEVGVRQLRCHLMVLRSHLNQENEQRLLGLLRDLSQNNAPMIQALKTLFGRYTLSLCNKIAIEEGLYVVFAKLLTLSTDTHPGSVLTTQTVFEYSRLCLSLMIKFVSQMNAMPNTWKNREVFVSRNIMCSLQYQPINSEPVYLTLDDKSKVVCDRVYLE